MAHRNTIPGAWANFWTYMQGLVGVTGDDSTLQIRQVIEGEAGYDDAAVPFVVFQLLDASVERRTDGDKLWKQRLKIRVVTSVTTANGATTEIFAKVGAIEDRIESYSKPDGVAGFENAEWSVTYDSTANHGSLVVAESVRTFTVMVTRGAN